VILEKHKPPLTWISMNRMRRRYLRQCAWTLRSRA
jgi:hypothetical protein